MADYPDWTDSVAIIAAEIMLPIDMQASYIMMPVDIQAQYVTLNIDITAQTLANLKVDINAASIGNIGIDIKAATIGNLTIDIEAQSVGMYLQPDWNVNEGKQKSLTMAGTNLGEGATDDSDYEVAVGKTLFITQASFSVRAYDVASADLNQIGALTLYRVDPVTVYLTLGGNGGGGIPLTAPAKISAGQTVRLRVTNVCNHHINYEATWAGYEL